MIRFSLALFIVIVTLLIYITILLSADKKIFRSKSLSYGSSEIISMRPATPKGGSSSAGESFLISSESLQKTGFSNSRSTTQESNKIFPSTASATANLFQTKTNLTDYLKTRSVDYSRSALTQNSESTGAVGGGGGALEIAIPVPEGAKVPVVFFDAGDKPFAQQRALDRIAREFEKNVTEIPVGLTKQEVWEVARAIADERFIKLYGYQAYSQYHIQAAKEALKEKRARLNTTGP